MDKHLTYYLQLTKATLTGGFFTSKGFYSVGGCIGIGWKV